MFVKNWMRVDTPKVNENTRLREIYGLFDMSDVLLVVDRNERFVGILKRDKLPDDETAKVKDFIIPMENYLRDEDYIEHAALLLVETGEKFLPVLDSKGKPIGTIGIYDVLDALIHLTAFEERGIKILMELQDKPGQLKKVVDLLYVNKINILSVLTHKKEESNEREVSIKVDFTDMKKLRSLFEDAKIKFMHMSMEEDLWNSNS